MSEPKLIDQDMGPISHSAADRALASGDAAEISLALLRLALHGPGWSRAEQLARDHATHDDVWVRRNAATALGHVARVHGSIDLGRTLPVLLRLLNDSEVADWADAALDDIEMYLGVHVIRRAERSPGRRASSSISSIGYDPRKRVVDVAFKSGAVYRYLDVPADVFAAMRAAESIGKYLHEFVKPHFAAVKVKEKTSVEQLPVRDDRVAA